MVLIVYVLIIVEETLEIMMLDCPLDKPLPFFQTFVHHIWNVFHTICCDLSELRHLVSVLSSYLTSNDQCGHNIDDNDIEIS